jgi:hypothetical protein
VLERIRDRRLTPAAVTDVIGANVHKHANEMLADGISREDVAIWVQTVNGYAFASQKSLRAIGAILRDEDEAKELRELLRVGIHRDVEVTDVNAPGPRVSQAFCCALPVAYSNVPQAEWAPFGHLVVQAAYEATLSASLLNASRGASNKVLLTRIGGGAFGNPSDWIDRALVRALEIFAGQGLEVLLVSRSSPSLQERQLAHQFAS